MIDMHMHSTYSDGFFTPTELLQKAEAEHLDYMAITDHDAVKAYEELKNIDTKKYFSGKIVLGSEIRFVYNKTQFEVLAYGYDYDRLKQSYWVQKVSYHDIKKALLKNCLEKAKNLGFIYDNIEYNEDKKPEREFYSHLIENEHNVKILQQYDIKHSGEFFRKLIANKNSPMFFDATDYSLSLKDAVELIHSCGGVAVLAHPFGVYNDENPIKTLNEMLSLNLLDGLECYHENISKEQTKYLLGLCKKYDLISTGGSDFHGHKGQTFARANFGQDEIPTKTIEKLLAKINPENILG